MEQQKLFTPLRILGYAVLALQFAAIIYAAVIAIRYWPGIGV